MRRIFNRVRAIGAGERAIRQRVSLGRSEPCHGSFLAAWKRPNTIMAMVVMTVMFITFVAIVAMIAMFTMPCAAFTAPMIAIMGKRRGR
jgi:hypothetical protein